MAIGDDFEVQNDADIRYIGAAHGASGAGYYSVLEFHRWLQQLAGALSSSGDDFLDITRETPSNKLFETIIELLGAYNIDSVAAEHLYGGSIIQSGGDEIWDGLQVVANEGVHVEIIQNGAVVANDFWNSIPFGDTEKGLNRDVPNGISHRFMLKVRNGGADIDGRRLLCQTREFGFSYSEFRINGTGRGVNVVPLTYVADNNNTTLEATVAGWTAITNLTQGYIGIDVNNDSVNEFYYSRWDRDTFTINQFYERMKWLTRRGSASTLYGLNGEVFRGITHEVNIVSPSGTFDAFEPVSWGTGPTAGTGQMLAINSPTAGTKMWIQLLTGVAPSGPVTITGGSSSATAVNSGTPVSRTVAQPFCGQSTGSALIGAYGFALEAMDLSATDTVTALDNVSYQAPNYVTFSVQGVVATEDSILVGPADGGNLDEDQLSLNGALTGAAVTAVVVTAAIPADTPATGTIRIQRANNRYTRHAYTSWSGSTFTIAPTDFSGVNANNGANVFISYIDKIAAASTESFTTIFSAPRSLYVRVRDPGVTPIKTFETTATLGASGGSATAIRISD